MTMPNSTNLPPVERAENRRRKRHESRTASTYKLFLRTLRDRLALPEPLVEQAAVSVLCALEQRLIPDEAKNLEAQLPQKLRELLVHCARRVELRPRDIGRAELLGIVASDLGISILAAEDVVRNVFHVLTLQVSPGELQSVLSTLPSDMRELWPSIPPDVHRARAARPRRERT